MSSFLIPEDLIFRYRKARESNSSLTKRA